MDCSPPGSSVHGDLQARTLEWVATLYFKESSWPRDQTWVSCIAAAFFFFFFFYLWATRDTLLMAAAAKSLQSCTTLCDQHGRQPTGLCHPWDFPGKNAGVGRHFLLPPNGSLVANNQSPVPLPVMIRESAFGTFMSFLFPHKGLFRYS